VDEPSARWRSQLAFAFSATVQFNALAGWIMPAAGRANPARRDRDNPAPLLYEYEYSHGGKHREFVAKATRKIGARLAKPRPRPASH